LDSTATLVWGMVLGAIGLGFFTYGTKQRAAVPLLAGVALFLIPYFITNVYLLVLAGGIVIAVPYFVRL
jgi:predicted membrane protein